MVDVSIRLIEADQGGWGGGDGNIWTLSGRSQEHQTMRCTELSSREPLVVVSTGTDHRGLGVVE